MNRLKYIIIMLFLAGISQWCFGQYEMPGEKNDIEKEKNKSKYLESRFFFGGNLGLAFGTNTYIELSPLAGYKITERLWAGLGPKYMYENYRYRYERSTYGLKTFAIFTILKDISEKINLGIGDIFAYAENETLSARPSYYNPITNEYFLGNRNWYNITLVGGGMRFPIGQRSGFSIMALWDITQNPEYSYYNPEVRISFDF